MEIQPQPAPPRLYAYQQNDIDAIFSRIETHPQNYRLLYQLPTGGGKTVIFSEIAKRYFEKYGQKVIVLTHRIELCRQTAKTLKGLGLRTKIISSDVTRISARSGYDCYIAMVETLKNRIKSGDFKTRDIGLVIIDEAHYNAFRKLMGKFDPAFVIGVTATPLSSDRAFPIKDSYNELYNGESIASLVSSGFLAKPKNIVYDVELHSLKTGINGDFTIGSSDQLYASPAMLQLLLEAYEKHSKNKKTLIFNNGITASKRVEAIFSDAGYAIKHLDNRTASQDRESILKWFRKTPGAILTSVSILTTGFDEPTVQSVILYRATTSLTLYHQMVGRGARSLPRKKTFTIIDLGNNTERFGQWHEPVDWAHIFSDPDTYYEQLHYANTTAGMPQSLSAELRPLFPNSLEIGFDVEQAYHNAESANLKHSTVIRDAIRQHAKLCLENSETLSQAVALVATLDKEIARRVKVFAKCRGETTKNYRDWLYADYKKRLEGLVRKLYYLRGAAQNAADVDKC